MVIYGDVLFLENFILGCIFLYVTLKLNFIRISNSKDVLRILYGGLMCGAFSLVIFLMLPSYLIMCLQVPFAIVANWVAHGRCNVLRRSFVFIVVTYLAGGITMVILLMTDNNCIYTPVAIYTGSMRTCTLMAAMTVLYIASSQIVRLILNIKIDIGCNKYVMIKCGDRTIETTAFVDTGNNLCDPVSRGRVNVASESLWRKIEKEGFIEEQRIRLIPYEAVGTRGMLQAIRVDAIISDGKQCKNCIIAGNDSSFAMNAELLLSAYLVWEGRQDD